MKDSSVQFGENLTAVKSNRRLRNYVLHFCPYTVDILDHYKSGENVFKETSVIREI